MTLSPWGERVAAQPPGEGDRANRTLLAGNVR